MTGYSCFVATNRVLMNTPSKFTNLIRLLSNWSTASRERAYTKNCCNNRTSLKMIKIIKELWWINQIRKKARHGSRNEPSKTWLKRLLCGGSCIMASTTSTGNSCRCHYSMQPPSSESPKKHLMIIYSRSGLILSRIILLCLKIFVQKLKIDLERSAVLTLINAWMKKLGNCARLWSLSKACANRE